MNLESTPLDDQFLVAMVGPDGISADKECGRDVAGATLMAGNGYRQQVVQVKCGPVTGVAVDYLRSSALSQERKQRFEFFS